MKKLLQFALGPISGAIISFVTVPLITYFLLPEEIGRAGMFTMVQALMPTICLGLDQAYTREFYVEDDKKNLLLNSMLLPFSLAVLVFIIFTINSAFFSRILFDQDNYNLVVILIGFSAITTVLQRFILLKIRMEEKALEYSIFTFALKIIIFLLTFIFIIFIRTDFLSIVYAKIIGQMVICCVLVFRYVDSSDISMFKVNKKLKKKLLFFGMPLVISVLVENLLKSSSTIALRYFSDFEELGLFSIGNQVTNLLMVIQASFMLIWKPIAYRWHEEKRKMKDYQLVSEIVLAVMSFVFLALLFLRPVIAIFISGQFDEAQYLLGFLSFYPIMFTLMTTTKLGIRFSRKNYLSVIAAIASLLVNLLLNILFIPNLGALGAAIAIGVSYVFYFILLTFLSFSVWEGFSIKKHLCIISLMLAIAVVDVLYPNQIIYVKIGCLILFLIIHKRIFHIIIKYGFNFKKANL